MIKKMKVTLGSSSYSILIIISMIDKRLYPFVCPEKLNYDQSEEITRKGWGLRYYISDG